MSAAGRWFRLNTTWSQSEWLAVLTPAARLAWVELLGYTKAHGYDGKVRAVAPSIFGRQFGIPTEDVCTMLAAAESDCALETSEGQWTITGWDEHQGDATSRERMRRYRGRKASGDDATEVTRNHRSVTPTETETKTNNIPAASAGGGGEPSDPPPEPPQPRPPRPTPNSWSGRACAAWVDAFGGTAPGGRIGKALQPLVAQHGEPAVLDAWTKYLTTTEPQFATPEQFAGKFGVYSGRRRNGRVEVPTAPKVTEFSANPPRAA